MRTRLLLFFFSITLTGFAQMPAGKSWSLQECIDYALANSLSIKRSNYNLETSIIDYEQSRWNLLPNINASANYGSNWGRSVNPVTYQYTTRQLTSLNPNISSGVTLFNGFRLQNLMKQTSRNKDAAEEDLVKAKNDVMLNITSLYINVIFNKEQLENAKFQLASSKSQYERVQKQVAAGALPRSEELNLDAQVASNELTQTSRENALALSLLQLKQALMLPASEQLDVIAPALEIEDLVLTQNRDEIYSLAKGTMPEIKAANLRVESSYSAVKAAKAQLLPRLTLNGSVNSNYSSASKQRFVSDGGFTSQQIGSVDVSGTQYIVQSNPIATGTYQDVYMINDQLKDNISKQLGVTLSIPIFNNFSARNGWQRSVISQEIAKINLSEVENTLRQNVETSYNDALAASKTYNSAMRQVQAREEAFRMMEQRFNIGSANYFEFQVSQNSLFSAKSDLIRAKYDFIFRKKILDFYMGQPLKL